MEVEDFARVAKITAELTSRGFTVTDFATEREMNPVATSEVSMLYAWRPSYHAAFAKGTAVKSGAAASPAAAAPRSQSRSKSASKPRAGARSPSASKRR